jgi:hypothetical protein
MSSAGRCEKGKRSGFNQASMKQAKWLHLCLTLFCLVVFNGRPANIQAQVAARRPSAHPAAAVADWRFGVIESYESPAEAATLGVGWTRVRFQWAETQAGGPGTWTPAVSDAQINAEISAGRTVVGLLIGVPGWARDDKQLPSGLWLPHDDPGNSWGGFVREAVSRYSGRINQWIIWNEPDIADPAAPGFTWHGSVEDFFQLQRTAYLVAKQANPNAIIHLAAFTHFWDPSYIYRFLDVLVADPAAAGNNFYFDVASAHLYFQPNAIYEVVQTIYGAMSSRGITGKGVWLVETNAPPINDPEWPVPNWSLSVTQDEQAAFIPQALASAMAAGAQRIAVYKLKDTAEDRAANPEPFGLLRLDGSRRPAFTTYQVAIRYLAGVQGAQRERWNEVGQILLNQGEYSTTVLFARLPAPQRAEVPATAASAVLVDMWGSRRNITAQNGVFTVDLAGALCSQPIGDYCMIGGTVYYLVQSTSGGGLPPAPAGPIAPAPATPEVTPMSTATVATATVRPTARATATVTATETRPPTSTPRPTVTKTAVPSTTFLPTATATIAPTAVAQRPPTLVATAPPDPGVAEEAKVAPVAWSYWFIGAALLLALGLVGWRQRAAR